MGPEACWERGMTLRVDILEIDPLALYVRNNYMFFLDMYSTNPSCMCMQHAQVHSSKMGQRQGCTHGDGTREMGTPATKCCRSC